MPRGSRADRDREFMTNATNAPNVTISPWAKFDNPVVPKISDSPIEVIAMIIASFNPLASVCGSRLHLLCTSRELSPRKKARVTFWFPPTSAVCCSLPSSTVRPSGRVSVSMRTMYTPGSLDRDQVHTVGVRDRFADDVPALVLDDDAHVGHRLGDPLAVFVLGTVLHAPGDRLSRPRPPGRERCPTGRQAPRRRASNDDCHAGQDAR